MLSIQLDSLGQKDDLIYRSILGMDPLDPDIRRAGTGGIPSSDLKYPEIVNQTAEKIENLRSKLAVEENSLIKIREFAGKNRERINLWNRAVDYSKALGSELWDIIETNSMADRIKPIPTG